MAPTLPPMATHTKREILDIAWHIDATVGETGLHLGDAAVLPLD